MLRFFRSIRRRLLDSGSLQKYLVYAVGEILLVVIGILIALQINNWNEQGKNNLQESSLLIKLSRNMESKIAVIKETVEPDAAGLQAIENFNRLCPSI